MPGEPGTKDRTNWAAPAAGMAKGQPRHRLPASARTAARRWTLLALIPLLAGGWSGVGAEHPPAGASPGFAPATCAVPAAVATTTRSAATPGAARPGDGTPLARETATAAADPEAALAAELTAVAEALAACFSEGRAPVIATLATERYLGQLYGGGVPLPREDYLALAPDLDRVPMLIRSVRDVRREEDGSATAEVVSVVGRQLLRSRWTFVLAPQAERKAGRIAWRVDGEQPLSFDPPEGASRLEVAIEEYAFGLDETEADGPVVVLEGRNGGAEDHELLVLRFEEGVTTDDLLRQPGPGLPDGVTYVGQVTVPAGERAELVLVDLERGDYTIVCLFLTPRGTPHLALGMAATFTVE